MTATIQKLGGNQYKVTIEEQTQKIDLDGYTIMSNEDFAKIKEAGFLGDDMWCPSLAQELFSEDQFFCEAIKFVANYSGFDAERYIQDNQ